jgi:ribosome-binding factor A
MGNVSESKSRRRSAQCIRVPRLEQLFCEELCSLFADEINDARLEGVRVTRVELSCDGSRARVWFELRESSLPERDVLIALQHARGFLRSRLCDALPLKRIPELGFRREFGGRLVDDRESE